MTFTFDAGFLLWATNDKSSFLRLFSTLFQYLRSLFQLPPFCFHAEVTCSLKIQSPYRPNSRIYRHEKLIADRFRPPTASSLLSSYLTTRRCSTNLAELSKDYRKYILRIRMPIKDVRSFHWSPLLMSQCVTNRSTPSELRGVRTVAEGASSARGAPEGLYKEWHNGTNDSRREGGLEREGEFRERG